MDTNEHIVYLRDVRDHAYDAQLRAALRYALTRLETLEAKNAKRSKIVVFTHEKAKHRVPQLAIACSTCRTSDPTKYIRCHRPDCTDGRG